MISVTNNVINRTKFKGIAPEYKNVNGCTVIPINTNPATEDIEAAIAASKKPGNQLGKSGYNGAAFHLGQDLVVKKYKGENAFNNAPRREVNILDKMYECSFKLPNSQQGEYAFQTPGGEFYLVSTKVAGINPNHQICNFNKENLKSLLQDQIITMDKGVMISKSSKYGFGDRCRFMNYDFNGDNINLLPDKAGLFDFEYSAFENIDDMIYERIIKGDPEINWHQSDTSAVLSSLRSFELWAFCYYMKRAENSDALFEDYLELKGEHHSSMADFYKEYSGETSFPETVTKLSEEEAAHSRLLTRSENGKIPKDIKKAEAIKIQMAAFIYEQSQYCSTGEINVAQLREYTEDATSYFRQRLEKAQSENDKDREIYYKNCLKLFSSWGKVNQNLKSQLESSDKDEQGQIAGKIVDKHILTLNDVLDI